MQLDLSSITQGTPFSLRHAAAASPEGPAPTITGPGIHTHLDDDDDDFLLLLFIILSLLNKGSCACFPSISRRQ